jgi:hypothetical protein
MALGCSSFSGQELAAAWAGAALRCRRRAAGHGISSVHRYSGRTVISGCVFLELERRFSRSEVSVFIFDLQAKGDVRRGTAKWAVSLVIRLWSARGYEQAL